MDKYLQEMLLAQLSVILPELGALTINEGSKEAVFNPYVKYNDEKFENYLVEKHNIEKQEAINMVAQYVKEIQNHINKGESFVLFKFGRFIKNDSGDVDFQNWSEFSNEVSKKETSQAINSTEETDKATTNKKVDTKKEDQTKTASKKDAEKEKKSSEKTPPIKTDNSKTVVTPIPTPPKSEAVKSKEADKKITPKKEDKKILKKEKPTKKPKEKKKRGAFFYVNIILLLLLIACAIFVYLNYSKVQKFFGFAPKTEQKISSDTLQEETSTEDESYAAYSEENDSAMVENSDSMESEEFTENQMDNKANEIDEEIPSKAQEQAIEEPAQNTATQSAPVATSSGSFHIIGGGFQSPENAEKFAQTLQEKGFSSHVVGVFDGLSLVSIQSYATMDEAQTALSNIASQSGISKAWIFKH